MDVSWKIVAIASMALLGGWVARDVLEVSRVEAQAPRPQQQFRECFSSSLWMTRGTSLNAGKLPRELVRVPPGWVPVGGSETAVVLCR